MLKTLKPVVMIGLFFTHISVYFAGDVDPSSLLHCWHPPQVEVTVASSWGVHHPPIARIHTGICCCPSQKPFITHCNRDGQCVPGLLQFPGAAPMASVTCDSGPSIQVNKGRASKMAEPSLSFDWNLRWHFFDTPLLRHQVGSPLSGYQGIYNLTIPYLTGTFLPLLPSLRSAPSLTTFCVHSCTYVTFFAFYDFAKAPFASINWHCLALPLFSPQNHISL